MTVRQCEIFRLSKVRHHMEHIALISDIHGNIVALETVLADIHQRGIQRVFCLGDVVGKGPDPDRAVDICRNSCEHVLVGNWDASIAHPNPAFPFPEGLGFHVKWHREKLGTERLNYLEHLPGTVDLLMSGRKVRLFHASQRGVYYRVFHDDPVEKHLAMFDNTDFTGYNFTPDVIGYADIHYPYRRLYNGRMLFNIGSVGNPLDKPLACYEILEGKYGSGDIAPFSVNLVRLPYDIDLAVRRAHDSHMPDIEPYEIELRTARYRGLPPSRL